MNDEKVDDQWHGFHEFLGIEDDTWTPRKVKELLKGIIESDLFGRNELI